MRKNFVLWIIGICLSCISLLAAQERIPLQGIWEFDTDKGDKGLQEGWSSKKLPGNIKLPGITDEAGIGEEGVNEKELARKHQYIGAAWYSREVIIPESWKDKTVELFMERVMWLSKVWVDGQPAGERNSLCTPHRYILGKLAPGKHRITLLIDNREQVPLLGSSWGHSAGNQTQIQWNGVLGDFELRALSPRRINAVRTFTDHKGKLDLECRFMNEAADSQRAFLHIALRDHKSGKTVFTKSHPVTMVPGESLSQYKENIPAVKPWDEFQPQLYDLMVSLSDSDSSAGSVFSKENLLVGFRSVRTYGDYIVVNDIPRFMRGNLDCADFPLTGYPPTDKESWKKILGKYKEYGFNHVRFHSWTPPRAAFEVADELGLYLLGEIFWRDGWMGKGLDIDKVEDFLRPELLRIADTYGNHASLLMLAMGNELGGFDLKKMDPWIAEVKKHDPRHLYATSVRRPASIYADVDYMGNLGAGYPLSYIQRGELNTRRNLGQWYGRDNWYLKNPPHSQPHLPGIQHEVGQWVFYPDWKELDKYTGLLRPKGMMEARELARQNGLLEQNGDFARASGKTAMILYKENIESVLRTPSCGGYQLLGMQDFTGQGIALIGWLDAFYDSKGIVTGDEVRQYINDTVLLMEADKYVFTNDETFDVDLKVLRFAQNDLPAASLAWKLTVVGQGEWASGHLDRMDIPNAKLSSMGKISVRLNKIDKPVKLVLETSLEGTPYKNQWEFWVFPKTEKAEKAEGITITASIEEALASLKEKKKTLLMAHKLGGQENVYYAQWCPAFWVGNATATNGTFIQAGHPAFKGFPTDEFANFQWHDLCKNSRGFEITGLDREFRPIVQPINDFHFNKKLASLFELVSPEGGKLLVCGYDIDSDLDRRPVARALRNSLVRYMKSSAFSPRITYEKGWLERALPDPNAPFMAPVKFKDAFLYIRSGGARTLPAGTYMKWEEKLDAVTPYDAARYGYEVVCDLVWKRSEDYSLWQGKKIHIDFKLPFDFTGYIALTFDSYDDENRTGTILHNGKTVDIGKLPKAGAEKGSGGRTVYLPLKSGETLLGKYGLDITCTEGANLLITEVAVVPEIPEEDR